MASSNMKMDFEKYDGKGNFTLWQQRVKDLLVQQRIYKVLVRERPERISAEDWEELEEIAFSTIRMCLADQVLPEICMETTAKGLWERLENTYMGKSMTNKLWLKKQLYSLRMPEGGELIAHIQKFNQVCSEVMSLDVKIDEEDKTLLLLCSLPGSYDGLITTLVYGKETLNFEEVVGVLRSNQQREKIRMGSSNTEVLAVNERQGRPWEKVRDKSKGRSKSRGKQKVWKCYKCHQVGHLKRNCPLLKNEKGKGFSKGGSADNGGANSSEDSGDDLLVVSDGTVKYDSYWTLDSACSHHYTSHREWFSSYEKSDGGIVSLGDDHPCKVVGVGTIRVRMYDGVIRTLTNVKHVPELKKNLISLGYLEKHGYAFGSKPGSGCLRITKGALVVIKGRRLNNNLYQMEGSVVTDGAEVLAAAQEKQLAYLLWHYRMGHMSDKGLTELSKRGLIPALQKEGDDLCEPCIYGKQHRVKFASSTKQSEGILELVHSDVWGPAPVSARGGARYFLTFIDDFSRKVWVYLIREKSEVFSRFKAWRVEVEKETGKPVKCLRSDNGGEYTSSEFRSYCEENGIKRHYTVKMTPQQNGVAERMNRTLTEKARSLRLQASLPKFFWGDAITFSCFLVNRSPNRKLDGSIPEEIWSGKKVELGHLKIFGCPAYALLEATERSKLDPKSQKLIFIGYPHGIKGYLLWNSNSQKCTISRNVIFDEKSILKKSGFADGAEKARQDSSGQHSLTGDIPSTSTSKCISFEVEFGRHVPIHVEDQRGEPSVQEEVQVEPQTSDLEDRERGVALHKPKRNICKPVRYRIDETISYALITANGDPETFEEAMETSERESWMQAMMEEMESLEKNKTWQLVDLPRDARAIGSKWVFTRKEAPSEQGGVRYKARLVAKGFSQREGVDYTEVFSPVVRHASIRVLLSLVAQHDMELQQMDVKTAFLHGSLEERIYMKQPAGFRQPGLEEKVCLLKRSLYGLKQSPRQWYKRFDTFVLSLGFSRSEHDSCVYVRDVDEDDALYLLLYVDDMLIASRSIEAVNELKIALSSEFEMKDLGPAWKILGMEIFRDRTKGILHLSLGGYIQKVLERFGMDKAKPVGTPLASHMSLSKLQSPQTDEEKEYMERVPYASAVGSIMYAMVCCRPDIAHAVSQVSRYMANPGKEHWKALKWTLRYLQGTRRLGLIFGQQDGPRRNSNIPSELLGPLEGFVDANFAGDLDTRRSTTGFVFCMYGGPVSWRSTLQPITALSTTEAEYIGITEAAKEALWLKRLIVEMGVKQGTVVLHSDSQSALQLVQNPVYHARTKHIDVRYHRIRELVEEGEVELVKVHTKKNQSDALTKILPRDSFLSCVTLMGLKEHADFSAALEHQGGDCRTLCGTPKPRLDKGEAKVYDP